MEKNLNILWNFIKYTGTRNRAE